MAVLYRTNFQSRQIEEALRRYGREYVVVGGFSFYQRAEVKDALAYLKALVSPQDSVSLLRIINTPARGIGKSTIEQIEQYALEHELSVWSAIGRMLEEKLFPARAEAALRSFPEHDPGAGRRWLAMRNRCSEILKADPGAHRLSAGCWRPTTIRNRNRGWAT